MALSKKLGKRSLGGSSVQISNAMGSDLWDRSCSLGSSVLGVKKKNQTAGRGRGGNKDHTPTPGPPGCHLKHLPVYESLSNRDT